MLQATKRGRPLGGEGPPPELLINRFNVFGMHRSLLPCRCRWCKHRSLCCAHPSHLPAGSQEALQVEPRTDTGCLTFGKSIHLSPHLWQSHLIGHCPRESSVKHLLCWEEGWREGFKFLFLMSMLCFSSRTERNLSSKGKTVFKSRCLWRQTESLSSELQKSISITKPNSWTSQNWP